MGDANTGIGEAEALHLLNRTGFGATRKDLDKMLRRASTRGEAARLVTNFRPSRWKPKGKDINQMRRSWLKFMLKGRNSLQEKMVVFLADHFSTARSGAGNDIRMMNQNSLFRLHALGSYKALARLVITDAAMLYFLDGVRNRKEAPNENFGREWLELFSVGVDDFAGNPNYTEDDIQTIARALTGWRVEQKRQEAYFTERLHDSEAEFPERGPKTIFTTVGGFGPNGVSLAEDGEGAIEVDRLGDLCFAHRDTDGKVTAARRITRRLCAYFIDARFGTPQPAAPEVTAVDGFIERSEFDTRWDLRGLMREILTSDHFYESAGAQPTGPGVRRTVRWPHDYVVSTLRLMDMKPKGKDARIDSPPGRRLEQYCQSMGMNLFEPPSVFGYDPEGAWCSSDYQLARSRFIRDLMMAREGGRTSFRPENLIDIGLTEPLAIVDAVLDACRMTGRFTTDETAALVDYLSDGQGNNAMIDLQSQAVRERKLSGLFGLVLTTAQNQLQ